MEMKKIEKLILEKKYSEFKKEILNFDAADIAEILSELNDELLIKFFRLLPKDIAAETFSFLELDSQQTIINSLTAKEAASIIDNMFADDATDLLEEMPANIIQKILSKTTPETRKDINQLLMYPTDSAGSIMTVEFMDIKDFMNVKDAINKVKKEAINKETIDFCYVIDKQRKLVGTISLKQLILANEDTAIKDIMEDNPIVVNTKEDQEEVANLFKKYEWAHLSPLVYLHITYLYYTTFSHKSQTVQNKHRKFGNIVQESIAGFYIYVKSSKVKLFLIYIPCVSDT